MSVLIRNEENDKIAIIYGTYMNKKELKKVIKGDKLDILCIDGLNYMVDVKEIDYLNDTISLHFIKWSKKSDYIGPLFSLYLAKLNEFSLGISPMNKYSPTLQTGEEKNTTIKTSTSNSSSIRGSLASTTRYPDDFLQKPRYNPIVSRGGVKIEGDNEDDDNDDINEDDNDNDSKNCRSRTRTTFYVHQEANPEKDGLATSGKKRNKDEALINVIASNEINKEADNKNIIVKKKKIDKLPISSISESSILEHQLFTFNDNNDNNDNINSNKNNQAVGENYDIAQVESPVEAESSLNELTNNSNAEKELNLLAIFQESLQFNKSITLNKFCINVLLQIHKGSKKQILVNNETKVQKLTELLKARRNIESAISSLIEM
jgi:hypothetical protein